MTVHNEVYNVSLLSWIDLTPAERAWFVASTAHTLTLPGDLIRWEGDILDLNHFSAVDEASEIVTSNLELLSWDRYCFRSEWSAVVVRFGAPWSREVSVGEWLLTTSDPTFSS